MQKYSAAVVGGGSGGKLSIAALEASDRYELVAVADLNEEVCAELKHHHPAIQTFPSYDEMFRRCPTDVVCVSTWPPSHWAVTLAALELPLCGILVEKPIADTTKDGLALLTAVKQRMLPMTTPHGLLALNHSREILRRVRGGEIGELKLVEIQCTGWDIMNAGIHWLNFFVNLLDDDTAMCQVMALCDTSTRTYRDGMQVETVAITYVQSKGGVRAVMHTGDEINVNRKGKSTLFRLVGTAGMIEFWGWEDSYLLMNAEFPHGTLLRPARTMKSNHQIHLDALAAQMDTGRPDYTVPESSLAALELCEAAYLSSRCRCVVSLPLADFSVPDPPRWDPGRPYSGEGGGRNGRKL